MTIFDRLSSAYDRGMLGLELLILRRLRQQLRTFAGDYVLDLGIGTGANLRVYAPATRVIAVDLSADMLETAQCKRHQASATFVQADVQALPFANESFNRAVSSLLFCSTDNPLAGLRQVARVLHPGGELMMIEHVRGDLPLTRWLTDALDPLWYGINGSCHLNRETAQTVAEAGLQVVDSTRHLWGVFQVIHAVKPADDNLSSLDTLPSIKGTGS